MVEIKEISFHYGKHAVLENVSFTAEAGKCIGILGNNGAGKSTLITCINRIRTPSAGEVFINGAPVSRMSRLELARNVSYVAQKSTMSHSTVFDAVLLGRKPYIKWGVSEEDIELCTQMIRKVGLEEYHLRALDELSGGEVQKVMLARALVQQPKLLLLDEPTSNLDPRNQHEMLSLVKKIAKEQGITVMIVIHDLNLALRYCDGFLFLKDKNVYSYGGIETMTVAAIRDVYGMDAEIVLHKGTPVVIPYSISPETESVFNE